MNTLSLQFVLLQTALLEELKAVIHDVVTSTDRSILTLDDLLNYSKVKAFLRDKCPPEVSFSR